MADQPKIDIERLLLNADELLEDWDSLDWVPEGANIIRDLALAIRAAREDSERLDWLERERLHLWHEENDPGDYRVADEWWNVGDAILDDVDKSAKTVRKVLDLARRNGGK